MRDLHCSEGTCTLEPPKNILSGGGPVTNSDMLEVIPYNQVKNVTVKKKRVVKRPLKGSGSKSKSASRKSKGKQKGQKSGQRKNQPKAKGKTDLQVLKTLLHKLNKSRK